MKKITKSLLTIIGSMLFCLTLTAQKSAEILPNSIILPRLSSTEQSTLASQQAGSLVFNNDQKKIALHDGTSWNYLGSLDLKNHKPISTSSNWTVPAGVTRIIVEMWGAGANGQTLQSVGANIACNGGGGGEYTMYDLAVSPNEILSFIIGYPSVTGRNSTYILRGATTIAFSEGGYDNQGGFNTTFPNLTGLVRSVAGEDGGFADMSFQTVNASTWRKMIKSGAGGGTYPSFKNGGKSVTMEFDVSTGNYIGSTFNGNTTLDKGAGGACKYAGSVGADGFALIHY
jgi:hypothetical protein